MLKNIDIKISDVLLHQSDGTKAYYIIEDIYSEEIISKATGKLVKIDRVEIAKFDDNYKYLGTDNPPAEMFDEMIERGMELRVVDTGPTAEAKMRLLS